MSMAFLNRGIVLIEGSGNMESNLVAIQKMMRKYSKWQE